MGDIGLEYEEGDSSPQGKGRKARHTGDETGCIRKTASRKHSHPKLSSVVKEPNALHFIKSPVFQDGLIKNL
jgi:hypothetical protein